MNTCARPGCGRSRYALGLCMRDYLRVRKHGDPDVTYRPYERQHADIDEVVVQRLVDGDPPAPYTRPERAAAVRILHGRGLTDNQIAARLGVERIVAWRVRTRLGLPTNPERSKRGTGAGSPRYLLPHPWLTESIAASKRRAA